jgi:hypothetical protein
VSTQVVVQGTLRPDGVLELDEKVPMPAGRVLVTVQPVVQPPADDPFWEMMNRIWEGQRARGHVPRSSDDVEAQRRALREEMEQEILDAVRLQEESRRLRQQDEVGDRREG